MHARSAQILAVLAVSACATVVHAAPRRSVAALLDVRFAGAYTAPEQERLRAALHHALRAAGMPMLEPEQIELALAGQPPRRCEDDRCRLDQARLVGARRLVEARFRAERGGHSVTLFIFNAEVGTRTYDVQRFCRKCDVAGLRELLPEAARELGHNEPEVPAGQLVVRTVPPGARISLDGRSLGESDTELPAPAGWHTLRLEKAGFTPVEMRVEVSPWQPSRAHVALAPLPGSATATSSPAPVRPPRDVVPVSRPLRPWAYMAFGLGIAAAAAGGVVLGRSGEPTCSLTGELRQCPELRGGRTAGAIVLAVGAAAVAAGVVLLVLDMRRARLRVDVTPAGAALSLRWR